jgi:predicted membrane-bound spermidine synthase
VGRGSRGFSIAISPRASSTSSWRSLLIGRLSAPMPVSRFSRLEWFRLFLFLVVFAIGILVGLELPILMRILKSISISKSSCRAC